MTKLAIVIPTYKRIKKLERCVKSILTSTYKDLHIYIYCDNNDVDTFIHFSNYDEKVTPVLNETRKYVIGSWNNFFYKVFKKEVNYDAVAWIVDDVELYPDCLEKAITRFEERYEDTDGVVGLAQECPGYPHYTYKPFGQCIIGRQFIMRYPDGKVCCPDYRHFYQDEEMWTFAVSIDKFSFCSEAKLKHYHPGFVRKEMDDTHFIVRKHDFKILDDFTHSDRLNKGYIWGKTFELINNQ